MCVCVCVYVFTVSTNMCLCVRLVCVRCIIHVSLCELMQLTEKQTDKHTNSQAARILEPTCSNFVWKSAALQSCSNRFRSSAVGPDILGLESGLQLAQLCALSLFMVDVSVVHRLMVLKNQLQGPPTALAPHVTCASGASSSSTSSRTCVKPPRDMNGKKPLVQWSHAAHVA